MMKAEVQVPAATISVLVPAAGCGARAALNGNKVLVPIHGQPLLWWTLRALSAQRHFISRTAQPHPAQTSTRDVPENVNVASDARLIEFVIAARDEEREIVQHIWHTTQIELPMRLVNGGATRAESVANCVEAAHGDFVLVHDAARPCLRPEVTVRTVEEALRCGAAIAALPVNDTVKVVCDENKIAETLDRNTIYLAQTPQVFRREWLLEALRSAQQNSFVGTDCASYVERWLHERCSQDGKSALKSTRTDKNAAVAVVRGEENNFKVTYAADVERASLLLHNFI